jgi:TolA-binding protein
VRDIDRKNWLNGFLVMALVAAGAVAAFSFSSAARSTALRAEHAAKLQVAEQEQLRLTALIETLKSDLAEREKRIEQLMTDVSLAKSEEQAVTRELELKSQEIERIQARYEKRVSELEADVRRYADFSRVLREALEPIQSALVVQPAPPGRSQEAGARPTVAPLETAQSAEAPGKKAAEFELTAGQVLSVDQNYGFIVSSLGLSHGVKVGSTLQIYRRNEPVGLAQVEKLDERMSAASIASEELRRRIRPGDRVVLLS